MKIDKAINTLLMFLSVLMMLITGYYVNAIAAIPMVDIVQNNANDNFFEHWHTTTDNLQAVSKQTLGTVGTVVLKTIYCDYPAKR